jgi:hypothetical protein
MSKHFRYALLSLLVAAAAWYLNYKMRWGVTSAEFWPLICYIVLSIATGIFLYCILYCILELVNKKRSKAIRINMGMISVLMILTFLLDGFVAYVQMEMNRNEMKQELQQYGIVTKANVTGTWKRFKTPPMMGIRFLYSGKLYEDHLVNHGEKYKTGDSVLIRFSSVDPYLTQVEGEPFFSDY